MVRRTLAVCGDVMVVNDGSTDTTACVLEGLQNEFPQLEVVAYGRNRGKGYALRRGFERAREMGFEYAVTLDADGQHYPEDIPSLIAQVAENEGKRGKCLVVGSRDLSAEGMPGGNSFANRFSNFWFRLQTGIRLPDTQTGFRLYMLSALPCLGLITRRYESELELLVFSAWRGVRLVAVPVRVCYPEARVSHFRPFGDFFRISVLNTLLCFGALLYGYPAILIRKLRLSHDDDTLRYDDENENDTLRYDDANN